MVVADLVRYFDNDEFKNQMNKSVLEYLKLASNDELTLDNVAYLIKEVYKLGFEQGKNCDGKLGDCHEPTAKLELISPIVIEDINEASVSEILKVFRDYLTVDERYYPSLICFITENWNAPISVQKLKELVKDCSKTSIYLDWTLLKFKLGEKVKHKAYVESCNVTGYNSLTKTYILKRNNEILMSDEVDLIKA